MCGGKQGGEGGAGAGAPDDARGPRRRGGMPSGWGDEIYGGDGGCGVREAWGRRGWERGSGGVVGYPLQWMDIHFMYLHAKESVVIFFCQYIGCMPKFNFGSLNTSRDYEGYYLCNFLIDLQQGTSSAGLEIIPSFQ